MKADQHSAATEPAKTAELAAQLLQHLGGSIPSERLPSALQRLEELLGFVDQLESLDIELLAPAATYDPSWDTP